MTLRPAALMTVEDARERASLTVLVKCMRRRVVRMAPNCAGSPTSTATEAIKMYEELTEVDEARLSHVMSATDGHFAEAPAPHPTEANEGGITPPEVLTVEETATLLRTNRKTVYELIQRGDLPGVRRVGRAVRVHRETVLTWLAAGQGRAPRSRSSR